MTSFRTPTVVPCCACIPLCTPCNLAPCALATLLTSLLSGLYFVRRDASPSVRGYLHLSLHPHHQPHGKPGCVGSSSSACAPKADASEEGTRGSCRKKPEVCRYTAVPASTCKAAPADSAARACKGPTGRRAVRRVPPSHKHAFRTGLDRQRPGARIWPLHSVSHL